MSRKKGKPRKHILLRTNILICLITVIGFALTAFFSSRANFKASLDNIEKVSDLTAEGIYHNVRATFQEPVDISVSMSHNLFLREFLKEENTETEESGYIEKMKAYLEKVKAQVECESVFLVSESTRRYYNFKGVDRYILHGNPENEWYFSLKASENDYFLIVDNDEVEGAGNKLTVFVNCKIEDTDGSFLGAVGVGIVIDHFQSLIRSYETEYGVEVSLLNGDGVVEMSSTHTGYETDAVDWFEKKGYPEEVKTEILGWEEDSKAHTIWIGGKDYIVTRYLPDINWHLVVEKDTVSLVRELNAQIFTNIAIITIIIAVILSVVSYVIKIFNKKVVLLTKQAEEKRKTAFEQVAGHLFENIYELDITGNRAGNRVTEEYFESLGVPKHTPFDRSLVIVANKQIKEEYRQGYIDTFSPENVLRQFEKGRDTLCYEFPIMDDEEEFHWIRIVVQIVKSEGDGNIRMYSYRQNIDAEKKQENKMKLLAQTDGMTGFLNRIETERQTDEILEQNPTQKYAFFIFDIDNFKTSNDEFGHAFGDSVIEEFAGILRSQFGENDLFGRIGGDEFVVLCQYSDSERLTEKTARLSASLCRVHEKDGNVWQMSASIGIALSYIDGRNFASLYKKADAALYKTKENGKNGFTFSGGADAK